MKKISKKSIPTNVYIIIIFYYHFIIIVHFLSNLLILLVILFVRGYSTHTLIINTKHSLSSVNRKAVGINTYKMHIVFIM